MRAATAEPFTCHLCGGRLGRQRVHLLTAGNHVVHFRCADKPGAHDELFPDCDLEWHDAFDHPLTLASRLGARRAIQRSNEGNTP